MAYLIFIAIAAFFAYGVITSKRENSASYLLAFMFVGFLLSSYLKVDAATVLLGTVLFNCVASTYGSKVNYAFSAMAAAYVVFFAGLPSTLALAVLLGFLSVSPAFLRPGKLGSQLREERRDMVQIVIGAALIAVLIFANYDYTRLFMIGAMLAGSVVSNYALFHRESNLSKLLFYFERKNVVFGQGAMWLAIGSLVAITFLDLREAGAVIAAIFIGDAVATIIGMRYGRAKLFYNRNKSVVGTAAYFLSALLLSFLLLGIGPAPVAIALVAAVVESLPHQIDDNFDTAIALTILMIPLSSLGLI
ncbi:Uncharacterised protein [uncultured archaeon]|nr:Uncharacterised protein [uncultured archaeon]